MDNPQWHALQVRSRFERIDARLRQRDIEQYLPLHKITRKGTHSIEVPLFPGYVFCNYDELAVSRLFWLSTGCLRVRPQTRAKRKQIPSSRVPLQMGRCRRGKSIALAILFSCGPRLNCLNEGGENDGSTGLELV